MKKEKKVIEKKDYKRIPVVINGEEYYTWPQAQLETGWERDDLRKEMKKMKIEPFAIEPYYLFVKCSDCVKLKEGVTKQSATERLQEKLSGEQLNKLASLMDGNNPEVEKLLKFLETQSEPNKKTPKKN